MSAKTTAGAKKRRRKQRQHERETYEEVYCKRCKQEIKQQVTVVFEVPLGWQDFSKEGLRSTFVKLLGVQWEAADWMCGCGVKAPDHKDARIKPIRRKSVPKGTERG